MLPKSLRPLYPYLKKYRRGFMVGTLCVLLLNGIAVQSPQVIRVALDYLQKGGRSSQNLVFYALLMFAISLIKGIFQFLTSWFVYGSYLDINYVPRKDYISTIHHLTILIFSH